MKSPITTKYVQVELSAMFPTADGNGKVRRKTGDRTGEVEMLVDFDKLASYFRKALYSKAGRSSLAYGGIEFRVKAKTVKDNYATGTRGDTCRGRGR